MNRHELINCWCTIEYVRQLIVFLGTILHPPMYVVLCNDFRFHKVFFNHLELLSLQIQFTPTVYGLSC